MEKQRLNIPFFEFWDLIGDDLHQHVREFHAEGFIHKGVETELEKTLNHLEETTALARKSNLDHLYSLTPHFHSTAAWIWNDWRRIECQQNNYFYTTSEDTWHHIQNSHLNYCLSAFPRNLNL